MSPLRAVAVGILAIIAFAVWFVAKTRDPSSLGKDQNFPKPPLTRRHELLEARNRIRRQIERLDTSPHIYGRPSDDVRNELQDMLRAIESELEE